MSSDQFESVLQRIRRFVGAEGAGAPPDRELLERFVRQRDETAFAALVQRHGRMVLNVCRRLLANEHDAEDACQATFLVLARRAASVRSGEALGSWLHGVAVRASSNLRRENSRRRAREGAAAAPPTAEAAEPTWREVRSVLDEELRRLPERFRAPLLLCYLEGKTRDEAARELGWGLGVLRGRLERGRELLRARLTRRGLTLSSALLAGLLTQEGAAATLPAALAVGVVRAAGAVAAGQGLGPGLVSARALLLMEGVVQTMQLSKLKVAVAFVLAVGLVGLGAGRLLSEKPAGPDEAARPALPPAQVAAADENAPADEPEAEGRPLSLQRVRNLATSRLNLKKLALAIHEYADVYGHFPPPALYQGMAIPKFVPRSGGPGAPGSPMGMAPGMPGPGTFPGFNRGFGGSRSSRTTPQLGGPESAPLLSWRVAILPFLGEEELFQQFKLDQSWDSPHNLPLLKKMPKVFAAPEGRSAESYSTFYQVIVGEGAAFEKHRGMRREADFPDGTSSTLLIVEGGNAVPWTKPEDLLYSAEAALPAVGGLFPGVFNAAFADGAVYTLVTKVDADLLRKAIVRNDGHPLNLERLKATLNDRAEQFKKQNRQLQTAVREVQAMLEELRREKEILEEMNEDPQTRELQKSNAQLEKLLRETRDQAEQLKREIERLKKPLGK